MVIDAVCCMLSGTETAAEYVEMRRRQTGCSQEPPREYINSSVVYTRGHAQCAPRVGAAETRGVTYTSQSPYWSSCRTALQRSAGQPQNGQNSVVQARRSRPRRPRQLRREEQAFTSCQSAEMNTSTATVRVGSNHVCDKELRN